MASRSVRVGWATSAWAATPRPSYRSMPPAVAMRVANVGRWINRHDRNVLNELYDPDRRYDIVVFVKAMDARTHAEAERVKAYGGRVVFDANVNYYEIWGNYEVPGTKPTPEQRDQAIALTRLADWVVADSAYLLDIIRKYTTCASSIPDNVDTHLFRQQRLPRKRDRLRLAWSGMAHKALHLRELLEVLASVQDMELVVVSNERPAILDELARVARCRFVRFAVRRYARVLRRCDAIVSPKRLINAYELGHSEWKITLGMAAGLPAIASPQPSYVEAIEHRGGGVVAEGPAAWGAALEQLRDDRAYRLELGRRAAKTVRERYATPVVAAQYQRLLHELA